MVRFFSAFDTCAKRVFHVCHVELMANLYCMQVTGPGQISHDSTRIKIHSIDGYYKYTSDLNFHTDKTVMYGYRSAFPDSRSHVLAVKCITANLVAL